MEGQRRRSGAQEQEHEVVGPVRTAEVDQRGRDVSALELRQAVHTPANVRPAQLLHLQRVAGNAAMSRHLTVQRAPNAVEVNEKDTATGIMDTVGSSTSLSGSAFQLPEWRNANYTPSTTASGLSTAGGGMGVLSNLTQMGLKSKEIHEIRKELKTTTDPMAKRNLERDLRVATGDVSQKVGGTLGSGMDLTSGIVNLAHAGQTATTAVGGAAAGVALPLQLWAGIRDFVKAIRQRNRVKEVEKLAADWDKPNDALANKKKLVQEKKTQVEVDEELVKTCTANLEKETNKPKKKQDPAKLKDAADQLASAKEALEDSKKAHEHEVNEHAKLEAADKDMQKALKEAQGQEPTLRAIAAYAQMKNQRGVVKKAFSVVGSALGVGGSIALIVAAAAGAAALMATPVGWALAGAAAAVALGAGIYKLVKWFKRRSAAKKAGFDKRTMYAETLLKYAIAPDPQGKEARKLIHSLGAYGNLFDKKKSLEAQDADLKQKLVTADADPKSKAHVVKLLKAKLAS